MALLNIFKKKPKKELKKELKPKKEARDEAGPPVTQPARPKKISGLAYRVLKKPRVTEKAGDLILKNQYVFEVFSDSNKNQIKEAVQDLYGVDVAGVRIININPKRRRLGRREGWSKGYKKAIVKIKEGQKIEVLPR